MRTPVRFLPSPGGGGSTRVQRAAGWGESLSFRAVPELRDRHPTPSRISLRSMRADPPPPGEGEAAETPSPSRREAPEVLLFTSAPLESEGTGKAGCALHPRSRVQLLLGKNAHEHTGSAEAI